MKKDPSILSDKVKETIETTYAACFSEDECSNIMSGLYSEGSKGFILEYDTKNLISPCIKKENCEHPWTCTTLYKSPVLIPVNYQEERYDVSTMLSSIVYLLGVINLINKISGDKDTPVSLTPFHLDYLFPLKLAGRKQSIWKHEKEWRLVYFAEDKENDKGKHIPLKAARPSSIILCPNCSKENIDKIKSIASGLSVPLYQLIKDYCSRDYNAFKKELVE